MKEILPQRKKIRLNNYDYSKENMYFITICVKDRLELLGKINEHNNIKLSKKRKYCKTRNIQTRKNIQKYNNR